jgi:hypothetical protein
VLQAIASCQTNEDLLTLYNTYPAYQQTMNAEFSKRRMEIETNNIPNNQKAIQNGTVNS